MGTQSLYQSWQARLKLLETGSSGLGPALRKEQREILEALLAKHQNNPAAQAAARFPVHNPAPITKQKPFDLNLRRPLTILREKLEARAKARIQPVVQDMAKLDPQSDAKKHARAQRRYGRPKRKSGGGAVDSLLHADVFLLMRETVATAAIRTPELLFSNVGRLPAEFSRLAADYARSMWRVISHSDTRDTVDYVVEELEKHDAECSVGVTQSKRTTGTAGSKVFIDRRAMLVHAYSVEERSFMLATQRVLHPVRDRTSQPLKVCRTEKALLDIIFQNLRDADAGAAIDAYGRKFIEENGRALDQFAQRLDQRLFFTDDVLKTFYVNLVYVSKALRLLNRHGLGPKEAGENWMAGAEAETREQLHDQVAELLRDPELRARALHHFRLELADGTSTIRFTAIAMVGRLGTLDDIGLLLDLSSLLPQGPGSRAERRALLVAARRIADGAGEGCPSSGKEPIPNLE